MLLGALHKGVKLEKPQDIQIMSKSSDARTQPPAVGFNRTRKIDKAAYVLKGIVDGVNVDGNLVDAEILYLDAWMRSQNSLGLQVVAFDLYQAVNSVLEDQSISDGARTDLNQLIQNILEFGDKNRTPDDEARINEFISMLKAICADGIIIQPEITPVEAWITANKDISKGFPIKPVYYRIRDAVKDNVIDGEELARLDDMVGKVSGDSCTQTSDVNGRINQMFNDEVDHFSFEGKVFCFAGNFLSGTRKQCQIEAEIRGAQVKTSVTADVDVLVIGSVTGDDWRHQNFGRKIKRAISLRAESGAPAILSEDQWTSLLNDSPLPQAAPILALV